MSIAPLREFVCSMTRLVESRGNAEADALEPARELLAALVRKDDWLPDAFAEPDPNEYRQYLLFQAIRWTGSRWSASCGARASRRRCTTT